MAGPAQQVLDLTAETYLEDGAIIDLDALDEVELAAYQPQRRRRKRQRLQEQVIDLIGGGFGAASALGYEDGDVRFLGVAPSRQRRRQQAGAQQPVGAANEQPADAPAALRAPGLLSQPELAAEDVARLGAGRLDRDAMPIADGMSCSQVEHGGVLEEQQVAAQQAAWDAAVKAARIGSSTTCCICMEDDLAPGSMFWLDCHHEYCRGCLRQHVTTAVRDDKMLPRCPQPDCKREIDAAALRSLLTLAEWQAVLDVAAEAALPADQRLYCPYAACSALMVRGTNFGKKGETYCPHCKGKLCGECGKPPHPGADCAAAAVGAHLASDAGVLELAEKEKWQQCPKCRSMVSRIEGCNYMTCTFRGCGTRFCYQCGKEYQTTDHYGCCTPLTGPYARVPVHRMQPLPRPAHYPQPLPQPAYRPQPPPRPARRRRGQ